MADLSQPNSPFFNADDHLSRLLVAEVEEPWYRSFVRNIKETFNPPKLPPLEITSKPVAVKDIWGLYGRQKKSFFMSTGVQFLMVGLLIWAFSPKVSLRQFTPPMAVINNPNPRLTMEPSIIAPPDVNLPQVNMAQYGDPLAKIGPPSNGPGSGGGIGSGSGGGVGSGKGGGFGPGEGGGVGGGVYRVGGGVTAPSLLFKVEPEYSEEARKAKYQGTVQLYVEVDPSGRAQNIRVVRSLGLGLDEKAIEAVRRWKFKPGYKDGRPVTVAATIDVNFRLL